MKISVVMQSYLGDYPGSRSNPREKFVRAVNSFLSQTHDDKELIVVSDGCKITEEIYNAVYKDNSTIRFFMFEKPGKKTYELDGEKKFYRGVPRQIGVDNASGEVIVYMDSDDIILSEHLSNLNKYWSTLPSNVYWISNPVRLVCQDILQNESVDNDLKRLYLNQSNLFNSFDIDLSAYGIHKRFFMGLGAEEGFVCGGTYSLSHRKNILTKWQDTSVLSGDLTEDHWFLRRMQRDMGPGRRFETPTYVICHCKDIWDL